MYLKLFFLPVETEYSVVVPIEVGLRTDNAKAVVEAHDRVPDEVRRVEDGGVPKLVEEIVAKLVVVVVVPR